MIYNFDGCPDRRSSESDKWHKYPEDVLPLWVADMDFVSPEPVRQALRDRVEHGVYGYPADSRLLQEQIVARMEAQFHWQIQADDILFLPGVIRGFNLAGHMVKAACGAGEMIIQTPVYLLWALARESHAVSTAVDEAFSGFSQRNSQL